MEDIQEESVAPALPNRRPPNAPMQYDDFDDDDFDDVFDLEPRDIYTFARAAGKQLSSVDSPSWSALRQNYIDNKRLDDSLLQNQGPIREICDMIVQSHGNLSQRQAKKIIDILKNGGEAVSEKINEPLNVKHPGDKEERPWAETVMPLLHAACLYNVDPEVVKAIVNAGGDCGLGDASNKLPLHHAAEHGSPNLVNMCLKNTDPAQLNVADINGNVPAICLVHNPKCSKENIDLAMKCGADFSTRDDSGRLPIHHVAQNGSSDLMKHLLSRMAGSTVLRYGILGKDLRGNNVAHFAAVNSSTSEKFIKVLGNYGVNLHDMNQEGRTPLSYAVSSGNQKVVKNLFHYLVVK